MVSPYLPHVIFSIAVTSLSIHIVGHKKDSEEERARYEARVSVLEQIRDHLKSPNPTSAHEIERLKRLSRPIEPSAATLPEVTLGWRDVWFGKKPTKTDGEMSEWDKKDLEKRA